MYHLGWFLGNGFGVQAWSTVNGDGPYIGRNVKDWMKPDIYIELAQAMDRAGFDYILIEDTAMVEDNFAGSAEATLRRAFMAPKNDPMPLVPLMAHHTKHVGIVPTVSTTQYHPYMAARLFTTLDHLTDGRVGMNVVTSVTDRAAQNYGNAEQIEHDERYRMADDWVRALRALQGSWEPDAVLADAERGIFADHTKVHAVNHRGTHFVTRGPLNTIPGPQGITPMASAGGSEAGRELAATHGDTMMSMCKTVEEMKAYRIDMRERLIRHGRDPESTKFLFLVTPIIAATDAEAQARAQLHRASRSSDAWIEYNLWNISYASGGRVDFGKIPLETPVAEIDMGRGIGGSTTTIANVFKDGEGKTLRELASSSYQITDLGLVGSPDTVAAKMDEIMQEVGGDGFLFYLPTTRVGIAEVSEGLAPALRRRGSIRDGFSHSILRENLTEF